MRPKLVRDFKYPNMYRVRLSNGQLTDMVNLSRANDLLNELKEMEKKKNGII